MSKLSIEKITTSAAHIPDVEDVTEDELEILSENDKDKALIELMESKFKKLSKDQVKAIHDKLVADGSKGLSPGHLSLLNEAQISMIDDDSLLTTF